jgi:hypothetical protein
MNIFVLDTDVIRCAQAHYDKHVVKMCLEYAQILSTSARMRGFDHPGYKSTHVNHPCVKWAAEDARNWNWLLWLAYELGREYESRYGKVHASTEALRLLPEELLVSAELSHAEAPKYFALAMPEEFYDDDAVQAYRNYYRIGKRDLASYRAPAVPPSWLN